MNCPFCKATIDDDQSRPVVGALKAVALDKEEIEQNSNFPLRVGADFLPLVAITCQDCGLIFFMSVSEANSRSISLAYHRIS